MLYSFKLALIALITFPAALVTVLFGLFDPQGKHVYGIGRFWTWMILKIGGVDIEVHGRSHVDWRQPYIFMANHQSHIDIPVLVQSLSGFQLRWIAKKELLWVPMFGWALWASKHITVDRSDRSKAMSSFKKAKEKIDRGISVVIFPEGTRSKDGAFLPFKKGGFLLALKTRTPIVPITINGSGAILPKGDWRIRSGKVDVIIGQPVPVDSYRPGNLRKLAQRVREAMESCSRANPRPDAATPRTEPPAFGNAEAGLLRETWNR